MAARLGFVDLLQGPEYYSTRTITDSTISGSAVGTLPASNLFNRNLGKPWGRNGLATTNECYLDLDLVRVRPDRQAESGEAQCAGIGMIVVAGITGTTSTGGVPNKVQVSFHSTTNAFASSGGTNPSSSTETYEVRSQTAGAIRTAFLLSDPANFSGNVGGSSYSYSGVIGRYIRIILIPHFDGGGTCDLRVGRILVMPCIKLEPAFNGFSESAENYSEVVTAYDGTPYTLARTSARKIAFSLANAGGALVRTYAEKRFNANVLTANRLMAAGADAALVLNDTNGGYQPMPGILGRLTQPLSITQESPSANLNATVNTISGEIVETPF